MIKILWIDDEIELLRPFIYILEKRGFRVDTAPNGADGLELFYRENYDLVLLDEIMPGLDGISVLKKLKQIDPDVKTLMITKSEDEPLMDEAFSYLVDGFIIKPFSPSQLIASLKKFVEQKELLKNKLSQEYGTLIRSETTPQSIEEWIDLYKNLMLWKLKIHRYGDQTLKDLHLTRRDNFNESFVKFFASNYKTLLDESYDLFSPALMKKYVFPFLRDNAGIVFILMDAMRYDQWLVISSLLKELYRIKTSIHLSILPSATPFARNSIFAGMMPLEIYNRYPDMWVWEQEAQNRYEPELLKRYLAREGITVDFNYYKVNTESHIKEIKSRILSSGGELITLVINFLDIFAHSIYTNSILKNLVKDEWSLLDITRAWFLNSELNSVIERLVEKGYKIVVTSDHGFIRVEKPSIIKGGAKMTTNLRYKFGMGITVNPKDAILVDPEDIKIPSERRGMKLAIAKGEVYFIYPSRPREYRKQYMHSFQHGGISLEEILTPVGLIEAK